MTDSPEIENQEVLEKILDYFFVTDYYAFQLRENWTRYDKGDYIVCRDYQNNSRKDSLINIETLHKSINLGEITLGAYSTSRKNTCKWIVWDFDVASKEEKIWTKIAVIELYNKCKHHGLIPYIEDSGNKGFHIWVFCDEVDTEICYKVGKYMVDTSFKGEIFPRQPTLSGKRYGNLVRLPRNINIKSNKKSFWLKPTMVAYEEDIQDLFFLSLRRTPAEVLVGVANLAQDVLPEPPKIMQINTGLSVDITDPQFEISGKDGKNRHAAQYPLVMRLIEAGYNDTQIFDAANKWLDYYKGRYKSDRDYALYDLKNTVDWCRSITNTQDRQ